MPDDQQLVIVATAENEPEADLIVQRLAEAGVGAIVERAIGYVGFGSSGAHNVYVRAPDEPLARTVLAPAD